MYRRHLELQGTYAQLLLVDYSSAFNTILTSRLSSKTSYLGVPLNLCVWINNFLTDRPQAVRMGPHLSPTLTLSTGAPQGSVLSPLLYSLLLCCRAIFLTLTLIEGDSNKCVYTAVYTVWPLFF